MQVLRKLLFPLSFLYGFIILIRNKLYDFEILKSTSFQFPIISVGNLEVGGSGKTPTTEYLIRFLQQEFKICVLSRGYGRKTKGFRWVKENDTTEDCGDEPLQIKTNFPDIGVAVSEDRVTGINQIKEKFELAILDDAYQHRALKPGLSILLFNYHHIFNHRFLLPTGNYREAFKEKKRAEILLVSKCPSHLSKLDREKIAIKIAPLAHQKLFFASVDYAQKLLPLNNKREALSAHAINKETKVILLTGIANPAPLFNQIKEKTSHISHFAYADHHPFSLKNIRSLVMAFNELNSNHKMIITTQKDAMRLGDKAFNHLIENLPLYYWPIQMVIPNPEEESLFKNQITNYARRY